jgi:hypothetical protein
MDIGLRAVGVDMYANDFSFELSLGFGFTPLLLFVGWH